MGIMAKLTYRKPGEIGKKKTLNHYQKLMVTMGLILALNVMGIVWLILNSLRS